MTWFLIILNVSGGQPTFIEMPDQTSCEVAAETTSYQVSPLFARAWCVPAGEWPEE